MIAPENVLKQVIELKMEAINDAFEESEVVVGSFGSYGGVVVLTARSRMVLMASSSSFV